MWNPVRIRFKNLFSHTDSVFTFQQGKITMILGNNLEDDGSESNGAGKSTIIEAIRLAIHGSTYRDVDKDDFIKDNADTTEVEFELHHPVLKETLHITRNFKRKGSAKVVVKVNGNTQKQLTSVAESNAFIFDKIGITAEDLDDHFIINQGNNNSFFTSKDTRQKEIIGRFANFTGIEAILENVKKDLKSVEINVTEVSGNIETCDSIIEELQDELEQEKELQAVKAKDNTKELKVWLDEYNLKIIELNGVLMSQRNKLPVMISKQEKLEKQLDSFNDLTEQLEELESTLESHENKITTANKNIRSIDVKLGGSVACPKCGEEFLPGGKVSISTLKKERAYSSEIASNGVEKVAKCKAKIKALNEQLKGRVEIENNISTAKNEIRIHKRNIQSNEEEYKHFQKKFEGIKSQIRTESEKVQKTDTILRIKEKIKKQQAHKSTLLPTYNSLKQEQQKLQFWQLHLGRKGFMTYLANKTIKVIEGYINHSLNKLYTNLSVRINGYTKLKNGDIRDKIEIYIVKDGIVAGKFARYSGGEKGRIVMCGILTFWKLINSSAEGKGLNFLCLDEIFEGLDATGQRETLKLLALSKVTTLLISHREALQEADNINYVRVTKNNKNSVITQH